MLNKNVYESSTVTKFVGHIFTGYLLNPLLLIIMIVGL